MLHRAVRSELATLLSALADSVSRPLPRYVLRTFDSFLRCGVFAHGFSRWHCGVCEHDLLVAFSCHKRGICPSCGVRRMDEVGAALVDRVLPDVPIRQWVLSLPWELRLLCARRADVTTAVVRAFWRALRAELVHRSGVPGSEPGALTFLQNFGGSLNLNLHPHVVATDGVFVPAEQGVRFIPLPPPTRAEVERVVLRARKSILRWLRRHGYLGEREPPPEQDDALDSLRSCQQLALKYGELVALPSESESESQSTERERRFERKPIHSKHFRTEDGFDLDARVFIAEADDIGRERLIRYCARPAIALERLEKLADGRYSYRTKYGRGARTHRVMTGSELIARIAALVPSPRHPLLRYHGVFAPGHSWRRLVVPKPRRLRAKLVRVTARVSTEPELGERDGEPSPECAHQAHDIGGIAPTELGAPSDDDDSNIDLLHAAAPGTAAPDEPATSALCSPYILTDEHLRRLLDGALLMTRPTASWAHLLRRSHDIDVLDCPKCHGRLRLMAVLRDEVQVRRFLRHFGRPTEPPPLAKARDPSEDYAA